MPNHWVMPKVSPTVPSRICHLFFTHLRRKDLPVYFPRAWTMYALIGATLLLIADQSEAQLFRRRRSYNYNNYYYNYSTVDYSTNTASDDPSDEYRYLNAVYSYDRGKKPENAFNNKIRVYLRVNDEEVLNEKKPIVAEVKVTDLRSEASTKTRYVPVSIDRSEEGEYKTAVLNITKKKDQSLINPGRVYYLYVNLHRKSKKYGKDSVIGRMSFPYYAATSGESRLEKARQQIAMRTFREWYYAKQGWQTDESYVMDCYAYYMWATGFCTKGATYGQTNLWTLFDDKTPFTYGSEIADLAKKNPIHGDYVRMPGHSFMLLAYDKENNQVWTMEGNYGATIEIVTRYVDPGWTVGHLRERHIRKNMFKSESDGTMMVSMEETDVQ